ncbi:MAG TPA: histidinol-phosphate transaminase [Candidatus Binatia bacterium]|nr:histidinol-phosphate transaminase [Candidatus Binatia bacterium]
MGSGRRSRSSNGTSAPPRWRKRSPRGGTSRRSSSLPSASDWLRPALRGLTPYVPGEQPGVGRRVIKLNTNENPYPPSPRVLEAVVRAADAGVRLYPDPEATVLRARAAAVYGVPADHVLVGNGSDELIALLLRATVDPGDRVAFPVPTYSLYETMVAAQGGTIVGVPFPEDWALPAALGATGARLTFFCNPNSPSGTLVPLAEVERLARAVRGLLVVDEAYVDFADPPPAGRPGPSALGLVGRVPNVVVLRTFSKSFSLAGLRVGLAFAAPELLRGLRTVKDSYNVNRLSLAAAEAALGDLALVEENLARIRATRTTLAAGLGRLGFEVLPSQANFVFARRPGVDVGRLAAALAARDILVRHFATPRLADGLRITVGTDDEVAALLDAIADLGTAA